MNEKNFYPGRLLRNLKVKGVTEDEYYLLTWQDESGNSTDFCLESKYSDKKKPLKTGDHLAGPVVILNKRGHFHRVALKNYYTELRAICPDANHIPWRDLWKSAFGPDLKPKSQTRIIDDGWEVRLPSAVVPVPGSRHLKYMKGKHFFHPIDMSSRGLAVYRPQTENLSWPRHFECSFEIEYPNGTKSTRDADILLHGILDPLKLHYNIWKHIAEDTRVDSVPGSRTYWNNWSGMKVPEKFVDNFVSCQPDDKKPRCHSACPSGRFESVNQKLLAFNHDYLSKAVTFFSQHATNYLYVREMYSSEFPKFKVDCDATGYFKKKDTFVRLHLRGACFNWNESVPLVHLHIVTFFMGPNLKEKEKKKQSERRSTHTTQIGEILRIKEVK